MDLQRLRYFRVVAEERHFGRAAARLYLAQPSLSDQIRRLETEIGATLFQRTSRGVTLTSVGHVLYDNVGTLLTEAERLEETVRAARDGFVGRLVVGFSGSHAYTVLPPVMRAFQARYPDVEIVPQEVRSGKQIDAIAGNAIDIGFLHATDPDEAEPPVERRGVVLDRLRAEGFVLALPQTHRLADLERVRLADLAEEEFVFVSPWTEIDVYEAVHAEFRKARFEPRVVREAADINSLMALVASGIGITLVSTSFASSEHDEIAFRPLDETRACSSLYLAHRANDTTHLTQNFRQIARASVT